MEPISGTILRNRLDELTPSLKQIKILENFDHIELSDEEAIEGLRLAREQKDLRLKREAYNERIKAQRASKSFSFDELIKLFEMQYEIDPSNQEPVRQICMYFANDSNFKGDLSKGLLLMGGVGVGKTSIMKFFIKNQRLSYRVDACRDIETNYSAYGDEWLDKLSFMIPIASNSDYFGHQEIGLCFDDLGTEANGKHYGKEKNVVAELILNRYDNGLPKIATHITTNLTADELKKQYGTRVTDRLREMVNIIQYPKDAKTRRV